MEAKTDKLVQRIYKRYKSSAGNFEKDSLLSYLYDKKRKYLLELNQYYRQYRVSTTDELEKKIKQGTVSEHPAWEDLIDMENLIDELKVIEDDIRKIS